MRYLIPILAALVLSSCAPVTQWLDDMTGTTLEERCDTRRAIVAGYDALARDLTETELRIRADYQIYIDSVCPPLPAPE